MATAKKTTAKKEGTSKTSASSGKAVSAPKDDAKYVCFAAGYTRDHKHGIWIYDYDPEKDASASSPRWKYPIHHISRYPITEGCSTPLPMRVYTPIP